ncbi:MAG: hypothetical protein PF542_03575 [Nanoarchaeota archaeon]|jgi:hypothetical protein|nr:hypothetical protein [Nanoarchaeota archaeon]
MGKLDFEFHDKKIYFLDMDKIDTEVSRLSAFPHSLRYFEEIYGNLKGFLDSFGTYDSRKKFTHFALGERGTPESFHLIYSKRWFNDEIELEYNIENKYRNIEMRRERSALRKIRYETPNKEDPDKSSFFNIFGEYHPFLFQEFNKENVLISELNYLEEFVLNESR